ncbi:shikimate dehydrogenase [Beggiatoa alba]|nr:shikimate dehydrogenase [Beggiatoa alba]MBN4069081.1 shikimate dehydrogenase [Beggiatoa alba]
MSSLFDFDTPSKYVVIGNPIAHSKSPLIHAEFARQTGQRIEYSAMQVDIGGFEASVGNFQANGGAGANITVPFKQEAYRYATRCSQRAQQAEAANTLVFESNHEVYADNTDGVGLVRDLNQNIGLDISGKKILILGAGGAVQGVLGPLLAEQPASIIIVNRTVDKAYMLAQRFQNSGNVSSCGYEELDKHDAYDIVINATSTGIDGKLPPLVNNIVDSNSVCYDMFYAAQDTAFVAWAKQHGVSQAYDGLGMLVEQAAESFFLWRKKKPQTALAIDFLRKQI